MATGTRKAVSETEVEEAVVEDSPKKMSINDLRKHEGPLYVENVTPMRINVHDTLGSEQLSFHLEPNGNPGYIEELPKLALASAAFRRLIIRGDVRISTDENMMDSIEIQVQQQLEADKVKRAGLLNTVQENRSHSDLEQKSCLTCGALIFQTLKQVKEGNPPLCPPHLSDNGKFVPTVHKSDDGKDVWTFVPLANVKMEPTRKG
jgi:hypothetical protein